MTRRVQKVRDERERVAILLGEFVEASVVYT